MNHRFSKEERLCSKRLIDSLFHNGSSFIMYPYRVVFLVIDERPHKAETPAQVIISVPKRRYKHAVDRNLLKRRMRECYRLQKSKLYPFLQEHSLHLLIAFQYVGKEKLLSSYLYERMDGVLTKIIDELAKKYVEQTD